MSNFNRTKIVATIGPASASKAVITELVQKGVNVFRVNCSHGSHEGHAAVIARIQEVNAELNTNVAILADLQGPKIRLGEVDNGAVTIKKGTVITLTTKEMVGTAEKLYISYKKFAADVNPYDKILIDDGKLELRVLSTDGASEVQCEVIYGGVVKPRKGVNLPETVISIPSLTAKDLRDLEFILGQPVNWIALSFVRSADEILKLKGMIQYRNHPAKVIAKIEKPEALEDIDAIIRVADAIMVARGDLGVEVPIERMPMIQKQLVEKCLHAAKPVIIATQVMDSMIRNPSPTRAEITDIATAVFDGADAIMLSGETAVGKYPGKVIETLSKVIRELEQQDVIYQKSNHLDINSKHFLSDAICFNACKIAREVQAKAILCMTKSGYTAAMISSYRPKARIYVFTESKELLNAVSLMWGVRAFHYNKSVATNQSISDVQQILREKQLADKGDVLINTGSIPLNQQGKTNMIKISKIK